MREAGGRNQVAYLHIAVFKVTKSTWLTQEDNYTAFVKEKSTKQERIQPDLQVKQYISFFVVFLSIFYSKLLTSWFITMHQIKYVGGIAQW